MDFTPVLVLGLVVFQVGEFLKQVTNRDVNGVATQLVLWAGSVGLTFLVAETQFGLTIPVGDLTLDQENTATKFLVGLIFLSAAGAVYKLKQAVDGSDSARSGKLTKL